MRWLRYLPFFVFMLACSLTTPPSHLQDVPAQLSNKSPLTTPTSLPNSITHTMPVTCTVLAQSLHLRECAGLQCTVLAWLSAGDTLEVLDRDQDWINVTTPAGKTGWVHSKYCGGTQ